MTVEEIEAVTKIMLTADSFCPSCQDSLLKQMKRAFPDHVATIEAIEARSSELETAYRAFQSEHDYEEPDVWTLDYASV